MDIFVFLRKRDGYRAARGASLLEPERQFFGQGASGVALKQ
jgi:hypothetical protein